MANPSRVVRNLLALGLLLLGSSGRCANEEVEALLVVTSDQHSSYERTAQFVARVKQLRADHPAVPMAILINGDTFEAGNVVAERSGGAIDYAMFSALARCAPTILNLGNHEPEFATVAETIAKIQKTGVVVITNASDVATGRAFAPATHALQLGKHELTLVGLGTPHLATYRAAVRSSLEVPEPIAWAKNAFPRFFAQTELPIVLSHAGLAIDRELFPLLPRGALLVGGHDHLRLVERRDDFIYFQSGSWNEYVSIARLHRTSRGHLWEIEQIPLAASDPADPELASTIARITDQFLSPEERAVVGTSPSELAPRAAAKFVVQALQEAAQADAAVVGATTFGAGLPQGSVSRYALNACVRFDGVIYLGEIEGAQLNALLARANQGPSTPFSERTGESLVAATSSVKFEAGHTYRLATVDWVVKNREKYLPPLTIKFVEQPNLKLKAVAVSALNPEGEERAGVRELKAATPE